MPRGGQPGNKNAKGNRGGGRKSAYQEQADAAMLWEMFFGALKKEDITAKLKSGEYSLKDVFISKAFAGNERILVEVFKKLFPDLEKVDHQGGLVIKLVDYEKHDREEVREMPADDDPKVE